MKKLRLIAVSARPADWTAVAERFYCRQLRRFELVVTAVRPGGKEKEAAAIIAKLPPSAHVILLAPHGSQPDSIAFAAALAGWLQRPAPALVIAGADGAAAALQQRADEILSLSALTLPHALARLVLVEQLFRADCALRHHPYPR